MRRSLNFYLRRTLVALGFLSTQVIALPEQVRKEAYEETMEETFPLTPNQIEAIKRSFDKENTILSTPSNLYPQAQTSTRQINLAPGSEIPVVRLTKGYISTLVFLDQSGQPWPVANYSIGDPNIFNIQWDSQSHVLFIQPQRVFAHGNMGVRLAGSSTPIMIQLACGRSDVDYRLDFTLPGLGPHGKPHEPGLGDHQGPTVDELSTFLDGKSSPGAIQLTLSPQMGQAWLHQGHVILRTTSSVISPKWIAVSSSSDGTKVYKLPRMNTVVLSSGGKTQSVRLEGL